MFYLGEKQFIKDRREMRILYAEDELRYRTSILSFLRSIGYDVVPVCNGLEAISRLRRKANFDVVVTDVWMPYTTGTNLVLQAIRVHNIPCVVLSASTQSTEGIVNLGGVFISKNTCEREIREELRRRLHDISEARRHHAR